MKRLIGLLIAAGVCATPASLLTIYKTPFEAFNAAVDFSQVTGADGISLVAVTATNTASGADLTSTIIAASPAPAVASAVTINGQSQACTCVIIRVQGGSNNQRVLLDFQVQDNVTGERRDGQVALLVSSGLAH